jgi:hypothetical protein
MLQPGKKPLKYMIQLYNPLTNEYMDSIIRLYGSIKALPEIVELIPFILQTSEKFTVTRVPETSSKNLELEHIIIHTRCTWERYKEMCRMWMAEGFSQPLLYCVLASSARSLCLPSFYRRNKFGRLTYLI